MDFSLEINDVLPDEVSKIEGSLVPPRFRGGGQDIRSLEMVRLGLANIINKMGSMSASTQGLKKIVTSDEKLYRNATQSIYLIKDAELNGGSGAVVGFLKVGRKDLYLHDSLGHMHQMNAFCILDFYVLGDMQRKGYGKRLFEAVLKDNNVSVHEIAVDSPSDKMLQFLSRHYDIHLRTQSNNFAVSDKFFGATSNADKIFGATSNADKIFGATSNANKFFGTTSNADKFFGATTTSDKFFGATTNALAVAPRAVQPHATSQRHENSIASIIHGDGYMANSLNYPFNSIEEVNEETAVKEPEPEIEKKQEAEVAATSERPTTLSVETGELEDIEVPVFDEGDEDPEEASLLPPTTPRSSDCRSPTHMLAAGHIHRPKSQLNKQGYFDIKYYHNQLW